MRISLVVAASENNVIGKGGTLPWSLPNDLQFFREITRGKPMIMGRKTFDAIGRVLPDRQNIVVSREKETIPGCDVVTSLDEALAMAGQSEAKEACVIGGGQIFQQTLPLADRVYLTRVHAVIEGGDTFFPPLSEAEWEEVSRDERPEDPRHLHAYTFLIYERRK
ncbi:MAG: dihydrofolate reductase [Patescibacteria group bacterium]